MRIIVNNKTYAVPEADEAQPLLPVLLHLGFNIPYFCWHPALGSIGACRQCAVKLFRDQGDQRGRIEMSCMVPVRDGQRISTDDEEVVEFQRRVIEWLMVNHPHDCPVCDEGGECHLQDMTALVGHVYRRYRGRKRTYRNQDLGPFVTHEMNRCIQCYRCVRFYRDLAGGRDFDVLASKNHTYFGRFEEGRLESEFAGNLVEVCPTGVFTDKTFAKHYTRKWDLQTAPSICVHCGLGCNIIPGAHRGMLRRIRARYHPKVNGHFICDRGRYGYEFVNAASRLRSALAGRGDLRPVCATEALARAGEALSGCRRVVGVGSPRAGLEANFALRQLVGADSFCSGLAASEQDAIADAVAMLRSGPARSAALREVEGCDAILILGADPTGEAPMLDLAIRRGTFNAALDLSRKAGIPDWNDLPVRNAMQEERGTLFIASAAPMKLDAIATGSWRLSPPGLVEFARLVAAGPGDPALAGTAPAQTVAIEMRKARRPLVVVSATGGRELVRAAGEVAARLCGAGRPCLLSLVAPECNSVGAAMLGGVDLEHGLEEVEAGRADGLIVLENDLFRRAPSERLWAALSRLQCLVVVEHTATRTSALADHVLPSAAFAECTGTLVNSEGRAQRCYQVFQAEEPAPAAWRVVRDLAAAAGRTLPQWRTCEEVIGDLAEDMPGLAGAREAAPPASWRDPIGAKIARMSLRHSGRAAERADRTVHEPTPPEDPDSPFAFTREGFQGRPPPALMPRYWLPGWNSPQARDRFAPEWLSAAPGKRLVEAGSGPPEPPPAIAPGPTLAAGEVWLVPWSATFGSEELSRLAPAIAELIAPAAVRLHPETAAQHSLAEGDTVRLVTHCAAHTLRVRSDDEVARGVAVVPAGCPESAGLTSPCPARLEPMP
jgi:NADH-quinone oxidoreductase subunit G